MHRECLSGTLTSLLALACVAPAAPAPPTDQPGVAREGTVISISSGPPYPGLWLAGACGRSVRHLKGVVLGIGVHVVEADLRDPAVRVEAVLSRGGVGSDERFGALIRRTQPAAAITGTFFGIRNRIPTGDIVIDGKAVFRGFVGTAIAIRRSNTVEFVRTRRGAPRRDWSGYQTVLQAGPTLIEQGRIALDARGEGFRTLPITPRRRRTAVALTSDDHLLLITVRQGITLWELSKICRALHVREAAALDGGSSTALYFNGRFLANPSRGLTNLLLIHRDRIPRAPSGTPGERSSVEQKSPGTAQRSGGSSPCRTNDGKASPPCCL